MPVLIPLFISAFRRADELAMAMECRCYRGGDGRTRLKVLRCTRQDYIDLAVCIVCFMVILSSRLVFPNFQNSPSRLRRQPPRGGGLIASLFEGGGTAKP